MDDFWGVIWGAGIALFAAIAGGFLTAVVGPALSRRAEAAARREERQTVADDEKRRVLRETLHALDQALRMWVEAMGKGRLADAEARRLDAREALVTLSLWTAEDEQVVASSAVSVLVYSNKWEAALRYGAWSNTAASWFRGGTTIEAFEDQFELFVHKTRPTAEAARAAEEERGGSSS